MAEPDGAFCARADLSGLRMGAGEAASTPGGASDSMVSAMPVLADTVLAVHDCPVSVVAKVHGLCVGAGLGLACRPT